MPRPSYSHVPSLLQLQGCILEVEGKKKGQFHVFSVVDRAGFSLMRMSTSDTNNANAWLQACTPLLCGVSCTPCMLASLWCTSSSHARIGALRPCLGWHGCGNCHSH